MALSTGQKIGIAAGAGLVALWAFSRGSKRTVHGKDFYVPDDAIVVWQGVPFMMRLPRGQWQSLNSELKIAGQQDMGNTTAVQVLVLPAPTDYVVNAIFALADDPSVQEHFTVQARVPI